MSPSSAGRPSRGRGGKRRDIHERALGLLAVRQRSRRELERRLVQAGFEPEAVEEELRRLEEVGLIDDRAFARAVVESRVGRRGEARRAVAGRLALAGVDRDTAVQALREVPGDEEEAAERLARARAGRLVRLEPTVAFQRLSGYLARRGYPPQIARTAARKALQVDADEG